MRVLHFMGDEGDVVPRIGGKQRAHHRAAQHHDDDDFHRRGRHHGLHADCGIRGGDAGPGIGAILLDGAGVDRDCQAEHDQQAEPEELADREDVLHQAAHLDAQRVDQGQEDS